MIKKLYEKVLLICLMVILCLLGADNSNAELIERIVAVVNDEVVLLSEFKEAIQRAEESVATVNEKEILDGMINDILLLEQARKFSFRRDAGEAVPFTPDKTIKNYIDKRIKALIYIPFRDIEAFYLNDHGKYGKMDLYDVKSEIEEFLLERLLEIKIREHIDQLRKAARIRVQLN